MPEATPEVTIDEMLADPIVRLVMARDGVQEAELRRLIRQTAEALALRSRLEIATAPTLAADAA